MTTDIVTKYVWIVDTINRYGSLTRREINDLWLRSALSDGKSIPERTFFHYRRAIESLFHIDIECTSRGEYYIECPESHRDQVFRNWLMDSYAIRGAVGDSVEISSRIIVENVPSAREFLPLATDAIRRNHKLRFSYAGFSRSKIDEDIVFHPYLVRLYKQRWYMVGYKEKSKEIRTYALDRVVEMRIMAESFRLPDEVDPASFYENYVGVTTGQSEVYTVKIETDPIQAKYFRALPFHHSQQEETHERYSIFTFRLKLNYELVHELLWFGSNVKILEPPQLKAMIVSELNNTLEYYTGNTSPAGK